MSTWIVKPLLSCSQYDFECLQALALELSAQFPTLPLAQSLSWNYAADQSDIIVWVIFNRTEKIYAFFLIDPSAEGEKKMECINGPIHPPCSNEMLIQIHARLINVLSQTLGEVGQFVIRPRLLSPLPEDYPFPIFKQDLSATKVLSLKKNCLPHSLSEIYFNDRLQRTYEKSLLPEIVIQTFTPAAPDLRFFYKSQELFNRQRNLPLPPWSWWSSLILTCPSNLQDLSFKIIKVSLIEQASESFAQILLAKNQSTATYLFGHEFRTNQLAAQVSLQVHAQLHAIRWAIEQGAREYDLGGILVEDNLNKETLPLDPYWGVHQFKRQFKGKNKIYFIPTIIFERSL